MVNRLDDLLPCRCGAGKPLRAFRSDPIDHSASASYRLPLAAQQPVGFEAMQDRIHAALAKFEYFIGRLTNGLDQFVTVHRSSRNEAENKQFRDAVEEIWIGSFGFHGGFIHRSSRYGNTGIGILCLKL